MRRKSTFLAATGMGMIEQRLAASRARYGKPMRDAAGHAAPAPPPAPAPAPAPAEPEAPAATSYEDAFASALAEETPPDDKPAVPPANEPPAGQEPGTPPAPAGDAPAEGTPPAPPQPGTPPAGGDAPAAPTPPAPPTTADDIVTRLAEALKQPAPADPNAPTAPTPPAQPEAPLYTDQETAVLADFEKNWPDVAQAGRLERRAEYHDLLKFVFAQVQQFTAPLFEMQDTVRTIGNNLHTQEVAAKFEGYTPELEANVNAWIDTQPSYLQAAMKQVMQTGTSDEVVDLFGRYRAANPAAAAPTPPAAPAAPGTPAAPAPAAPKTELSEAAKQAAASLAPVGGERSQVPQGEDPGDYESAFARHAATMEG